MGDKLDQLFQEWHRLGARVLIATTSHNLLPRKPEQVLADSTNYCRESGRLTWIVISWLIDNIKIIDPSLLMEATKEKGDLSVLGVICDAVRVKKPDDKLDWIISRCTKNRDVAIFFRRVSKSRLATRYTMENNLELFLRWNYFCSELRYL